MTFTDGIGVNCETERDQDPDNIFVLKTWVILMTVIAVGNTRREPNLRLGWGIVNLVQTCIDKFYDAYLMSKWIHRMNIK